MDFCQEGCIHRRGEKRAYPWDWMDLKSLGGKSILIGNESSSLTLMMMMTLLMQILGQD